MLHNKISRSIHVTLDCSNDSSANVELQYLDFKEDKMHRKEDLCSS